MSTERVELGKVKRNSDLFFLPYFCLYFSVKKSHRKMSLETNGSSNALIFEL